MSAMLNGGAFPAHRGFSLLSHPTHVNTPSWSASSLLACSSWYIAMDLSQSGAVSQFIREILDTLISEVTAPEDAVVANEEETQSSRERVDPTALFLLQSGVSDSLVVSLAYRATRVHVYQPRVARQRHGNFCGHFAFHFARCAHQLSTATSHDGARRALAQTRSRVVQWRRCISQCSNHN